MTYFYSDKHKFLHSEGGRIMRGSRLSKRFYTRHTKIPNQSVSGAPLVATQPATHEAPIGVLPKNLYADFLAHSFPTLYCTASQISPHLAQFAATPAIGYTALITLWAALFIATFKRKSDE